MPRELLKENTTSKINWWGIWLCIVLIVAAYMIGVGYGSYRTARFAANQVQFLADRGYIEMDITPEMKELLQLALTTYQVKAGGFIRDYNSNASICND